MILARPSSCIKSGQSGSTKQARGGISHALRRRVLFGIVAACISLAKSNNAAEFTTAQPKAQNITEPNCTPAAIEEFPKDVFTQEQRLSGGVILHFLVATYLIFGLGAICDDYFVPVLEMLCEALNLSSDVAGATFMAAGTSSPEFFTNIMGTFVTKSDLGIGTIVGSAVFNIFGVISVCGIFSGHRIPLDWYPITRDCIIYGMTVIVLIVVLIDEQVYWYESLVMFICYLGYIILMAVNSSIERWSHSVQKSIKKRIYPSLATSTIAPNESTPLHTASKATQAGPATIENAMVTDHVVSTSAQTTGPAVTDVTDAVGNNHGVSEENSDDDPIRPPWSKPSDDGCCAHVFWILFFPINMLLYVSIPDVRRPSCARLYPLAFFMCMAWIGAISYVVAWMITIIGYTIGVPDTVMGLSFLAVGTSIPEVFSSLIVSKQGKGSMAVSNSIGSNTFDILVCLGLPWMIKALMTGFSDGNWKVVVNSQGLAYTVISLLLSLILLYVILLAGRFVLSRTLGVVCLIIYSVFLTISLLFELNVFFVVNLPTCPSKY